MDQRNMIIAAAAIVAVLAAYFFLTAAEKPTPAPKKEGTSSLPSVIRIG